MTHTRQHHRPLKTRNPWLVALLSLLTLGVYAAYWWYDMSRNFSELGESIDRDYGKRPLNSLLAVTVGWLVLIPALIGIARGYDRVKRVQRDLTVPTSSMPTSIFVLATLVFFPLTLALLQGELNEIAERIN